ncbi:MAG: molecular chaperone DnaJ [Gammaproteobacteria bacterium]|jgi:hypothetical protein|nr:molecular chaperone DnaJ [Gammaproteobacteria bacterium]MDP6095939.1 molecular chaperone DnaJ [Gammaproteobacteria bacterium]HJO12588.1 molecular chaperone DnaJ [Gammaproteobacteria bacterium]|tara:strand:- start:2619 stop:3371 length:753 start_codon:yes stop_codon:yes gene_type:complete
MITRLLVLLSLPVFGYLFVKTMSQRFNLTQKQFNLLFLLVVSLMLIAVLILMGRLPIHFILAPLGVAATFLLRMLPTLLRLLPMWQMFKSRRVMGKTRESGQTSTIRTEFLAMELEHSTGNMDGAVLKGSHQGKQLSALTIHQLLELYTECQSEGDSLQVLIAYLDRNHADWRDVAGEKASQSSSTPPQLDDSHMTRPLALEILGLSDPVEEKEIADSHRALMQKLHPDRGGSGYLAKKINAARDFLLDD